MTRRPTFVLHQLNAELARICNPLLRPHDVDLITSRILVMVLERDAMNVGDIVAAMRLPQSTVSHQIKRLERNGFVSRSQSPEDHRAYVVKLTAKGKDVAQACQHISGELFEVVFGDMESDEMDQLMNVLDDLAKRLQRTSLRQQ